MKFKIITTLFVIGTLFLTIFVFHDDFIYQTPILKITNMETMREDTSMNPLGIKETYKLQKITGILTNTKDKGKTIETTYEESYSSVITDKYQVGDKVFLDKKEITGLKRDGYIAIMIFLFSLSIYIIGRKKGLLSIISVLLNSYIFYLGLCLYFKGMNLLWICVIESILFTIISLYLSNGRNRKSMAAILSTIITFLMMLMLIVILGKLTAYKEINFNELSFLTVPIDSILLPELIIGILGVSMDVSITITSSVEELIQKNKRISKEQLKKSSKEIGKDIMSTMSNVLFFTYICSGLPIFVLALRNGFSFYNYMTTNFSLECTRFLVGSIAIILTIPISSFISIKLFKGGEKNE